MDTLQPEPGTPLPVRASTTLGKLMFRFVGLLFLAVIALTLIWSN
jgi:hypothetical protein